MLCILVLFNRLGTYNTYNKCLLNSWQWGMGQINSQKMPRSNGVIQKDVNCSYISSKCKSQQLLMSRGFRNSRNKMAEFFIFPILFLFWHAGNITLILKATFWFSENRVEQIQRMKQRTWKLMSECSCGLLGNFSNSIG